MKKELIFCILQYTAFKDTIDCIESILNKCLDVSFQIIVVDNHSPDNSLKILSEKYRKIDEITILQTDKNLGFAKGNNIGINYAINNYEFDYLIVLNNDIELIEKNLYTKINNEFLMSNFSVLGPMIYTKDGRYYCNPIKEKLCSKSDLKRRLIKERLLFMIYSIDIIGILDYFRKIKNFFKSNNNYPQAYSSLFRKENVQLHGSFLVFSKNYFELFDGFDESTFMFMEEYFLFKHLRENDLISVYSPCIRVFHKEDVSTNNSLKSNRKKELFVHKNTLQSIKKLLILYEQYEKHH